MLQLLMLGGIETTTLLLGNLLHRVITEPAWPTRSRADPHLYEVAVEESLRLDSPTLGLFRTPNQACPVARRVASRGRQDDGAVRRRQPRSRAVGRPDAFRLDRDLNTLRRHYGFGHGIHLCLGAPLARLEGRVVLRGDRRAPARACATTASRIASPR